jgi:hypothetical protein
MEVEPCRSNAEDVPRLLVLWTRPDHLTRVEADAWVRAGVAGLETAPGVEAARVEEVLPAAFEHPALWHWLLELDVSDHAAVTRTLRHGPVADWVRDLRLLGMRPTVMLVAGDAAPEASA